MTHRYLAEAEGEAKGDGFGLGEGGDGLADSEDSELLRRRKWTSCTQTAMASGWILR